MISNLPTTIIETILCFLPIQEAGRTSILSKEWRYKWTKIPKLVFDEDTSEVSTDDNELSDSEQTFHFSPSERETMSESGKLFSAIYQVLLIHQGPILEFSINVGSICGELDYILFHLARKNTVKKLTIEMICECNLSWRIFLMHQLTDLDLRFTSYPTIHPTFKGFNSLRNLCMEDVLISRKSLLHLVSACPLLKSFTLLQILMDYIIDDDNTTIIELFKCLPMIENLSTSLLTVQCLARDEIPQKLPTALVNLKYLSQDFMCFNHKYALPFLVLMIKSSPNLERLKLQMVHTSCHKRIGIDSVTLEDYSDISLERLNELEIKGMSNKKSELDFVKFILAKSPVFKKLRIFLFENVDKDEELKMLKILLCSSHASPDVKIIVRR